MVKGFLATMISAVPWFNPEMSADPTAIIFCTLKSCCARSFVWTKTRTGGLNPFWTNDLERKILKNGFPDFADEDENKEKREGEGGGAFLRLF